jgi:hypothetical protein
VKQWHVRHYCHLPSAYRVLDSEMEVEWGRGLKALEAFQGAGKPGEREGWRGGERVEVSLVQQIRMDFGGL